MFNINGNIISGISGKNISVINNKVYIDGKLADIKPDNDGIIKIIVQGNLASLNSDVSVEMTGDVHGDVSAGNTVSCGNVKGNVKAGNTVNCGDIGGNAKAGNSIYRK